MSLEKRADMQIRSRLTLQFLLWVGAILLVSFSAIYLLTWLNSESRFYRRIRSKALTTAEIVSRLHRVDTTLLKTVLQSNRDLFPQENIAVYNHLNRKIYDSNDSVTFPVSPVFLQQVRSEGEVHFRSGQFKAMGMFYKGQDNELVVLAGARDLLNEANLGQLRATLILLYLLIIFLTAGIGWYYAGRALAPINFLITQLGHILPHRLHHRILMLPEPRDEIGELSHHINRLLDRMEHAMKLQKTFIGNVSHELRNPLTVMASQLEVSLLKERSPESYQQTVRTVLEEVRSLSSLCNSLMQLAWINEHREGMVRLRLDEIIWEARDELKRRQPDYTILVDMSSLPENEEQLLIQGHAALLRAAFLNLMENACKFSPDHQVKVGIVYEEEKTCITFSDQGPGIAASDLPFIFQPFYRIRQTADVTGFGIGLSLVEQVVSLHRGSLEVVSVLLQGTTFKLRFNQEKREENNDRLIEKVRES
jgi:signal transduction histidine kinase